MAGRQRPLALFCSYSHRDERHRLALERALEPLRAKGLVKLWWDGEIVPGQDWNQQIRAHLEKADIILLLMTRHFVGSEYCDLELKLALERRGAGEAVTVPVIVEKCDWKKQDRSIALVEAVPKERPVREWQPVKGGWQAVALGIQRVVEERNRPKPVNDIITGCRDAISPAAEEVEEQLDRPGRRGRHFDSIRAFWEFGVNDLTELKRATVDGTFSRFAPMLAGPPAAKLRLHKEFRQALERDREFAQVKLPTLDACLSVSAGQMVWRLNDGAPFQQFGLYNSIVRNAIPMLVSREYCETTLAKLVRSTQQRQTFEATVCGKVVKLDNNFVPQFFRKHGGFVSRSVIKDLEEGGLALVVDGDDTWVQPKGPPRYLDGDIWLAAEVDGNQRFLTSFIDITHRAERRDEAYQLEQAFKRLGPAARLLGQYDEVGEDTHLVSSGQVNNLLVKQIH